MPTSSSCAYFLSLFNLILAIIAIICILKAEESPQYFPLVFVPIATFAYYMIIVWTIVSIEIFKVPSNIEAQASLQVSISHSSISQQIPTNNIASNQAVTFFTIAKPAPRDQFRMVTRSVVEDRILL